MPVNISTIHNKVFGICCLEKTERDQVKKLWDTRFAGDTAFWIEADPQNNAYVMAQALCAKIQEQGIFALNGVPCILSIFLDLRQPVSQELQNELWKVSQVLSTALQCNIQTVLEFGFVGRQGFSSAEVQRNNAKKIVDKNAQMPDAVQHRLCLVGTPALAANDNSSWKAVVVFLDTLRRLINPSDLLPRAGETANDDIGFLRYGEYNKKEYDYLLMHSNELQNLCGQGGRDKLHDLLNKKRESIASKVEARFQIRGMLQPQHTDMIVPAGFMGIAQKRARTGNNPRYNAAQQETREALIQTGERLKEDILREFAPEIKRTDEILRDLLARSKAGLKLQMDQSTMRCILDDGAHCVQKPHIPELAYKEEGSAEEINGYLVNMKAYAIAEGTRKFNEAIRTAYEGISVGALKKQLSDKEAERVRVQGKIHETGTAEDFCSKYAFHYNPPICAFPLIAATGVGAKYLLLRSSAIGAAAAVRNAATPVYEINEMGGGIQVLDENPIKTIQAVFLNCSDASLRQLMP